MQPDKEGASFPTCAFHPDATAKKFFIKRISCKFG